MPRVSVIIPTYNRYNYLKNAIDSILEQTVNDLEIIIIDDASNDNTPSILRDFNDNRIKYIRHAVNKGGSAARNTGIKESSSEYIAFLDDDDLWLPGKLEEQLNLIKQLPPDFGAVSCDYYLTNNIGSLFKAETPLKQNDRYMAKSKFSLSNDLLLNNYVGSTSQVLVKKLCFERVGNFDTELKSCQDLDMWIRIARVFKFTYVDKPLIIYRLHQHKISRDLNALIQGHEKLFDKYKSEYIKNRAAHCHIIFQIGIYYLRKSDIKIGRQYIIRALKLNPLNPKYYLYIAGSLLGPNVVKNFLTFRSRWQDEYK